MQFRRRAAIAFIGVVIALGALALWYFRLQVWQHSEYATRSEANRIKPQPVVPGRGLILDRKGRVLADNVPAYRLDVVPDQAGDPQQLLQALSKVVALSPEDIERFEKQRKATRGFRAITLKLRVDEDEAARFAVDRWRFPGVELVPYLNRRYLHGALFAHVIGYVGRIDEADLAKMGDSRCRAHPHRQDRAGALLRRRAARQGRLREDRDQRRGPRAAHARAGAGRARRGPAAVGRPRPAAGDGRPRSASWKARRWRSTRAPARCWRWSACRATTPTCSSTASRTPTTRR